MKEYMKVKIAKIACKFAVERFLRPKKCSGNYQKKRNVFNKTHLSESIFIAISKLQASTLLRDAGCKL